LSGICGRNFESVASKLIKNGIILKLGKRVRNHALLVNKERIKIIGSVEAFADLEEIE